MKHGILSAALVATLASTTAWAGAEWAGVTTANFLSIGSGAAILGRGGATLGLGGDAAAVAWNAGALGWVNHTQIDFSHASLDGGINQEHVAVAGRIKRAPLYWGLSGLYQGQGGFEGRDASNQSTGTFNISSAAFSGQGAYRFRDIVSVGVGLKYVTENLGTVTGTGLAFDGGVLAQFGSIGLGASATNRHGIMTYDTEKFGMPANIGVGASWRDATRGITLAVDANFPNTYYNNVRTGVEWRWKETVALRAGYRAELGAPSDEALSGPTFGMGAGFGAFWADYGYVISGADWRRRTAPHQRFADSLADGKRWRVRPGRRDAGRGAAGAGSEAGEPAEGRAREGRARYQGDRAGCEARSDDHHEAAGRGSREADDDDDHDDGEARGDHAGEARGDRAREACGDHAGKGCGDHAGGREFDHGRQGASRSDQARGRRSRPGRRRSSPRTAEPAKAEEKVKPRPEKASTEGRGHEGRAVRQGRFIQEEEEDRRPKPAQPKEKGKEDPWEKAIHEARAEERQGSPQKGSISVDREAGPRS